MLLTREDGRALVVDLCDTVEHMRSNERSGFYQTQVAKFAGKLVDRPAREFYDVRGRRPGRTACADHLGDGRRGAHELKAAAAGRDDIVASARRWLDDIAAAA